MLHTAFIAQLDVVGVSPQWQLYAAQHLPDGPPGFQGQRTQLLQELLLLHAPAFAEDPSARAFLVDKLGVPTAWLAAALATWSRYSWQPEGDHPGLFLSVHLTLLHAFIITLAAIPAGEKCNVDLSFRLPLPPAFKISDKSTARF